MLNELFQWIGWLLIGTAALVLPGWALLNGLWPEWPALRWPEKLGLAGGLSLSIYPVLLLWTRLVGLYLGPLYAWAPIVLAGAWLVWRARRSWGARPRPMSAEVWPDLALVGVILLLALTRSLAIRGVEIPMWGDSYQHTVIAQLLVERGGLFESWAPYAELTTFTYHFGFHTAAAVFHWLTGLALPQSVLVVGQLINLLAVISLYPLATRAYRSPWSGTIAVLVAGLLLWTPMVYTHWGRYTQLAGQAILPAVVCLAWTRLEMPAERRRAWIPAWLALGGLSLTHFRVLIFAICFFAIYLAADLVRQALTRRAALRAAPRLAVTALAQPGLRAAWLGLGGGLLFLPWFIRLYGGAILRNFTRQMTTLPAQMTEFQQGYNSLGNLGEYVPAWVWPLLAATLLWALVERQGGVLLVAGWWGALLLATNPGWLGLPGAGAISNFAYWIAFYIPASVLIGAGAGRLMEAGLGRMQTRVAPPNLARRWSGAVLAGLVLAAGLWGAPRRASDLNVSAHALVTPADRQAIAWIRTHTPPEARFLVNSFPSFGGSLVTGSDAGWWLPLLAERQTSLPPLNYGTEASTRPDYVQWINRVTQTITEKGITHPDTLALLRKRQLSYVYIGAQQNPPGAVLPVDSLLNDPHFKLVYQQDGVHIFAIQAEP